MNTEPKSRNTTAHRAFRKIATFVFGLAALSALTLSFANNLAKETAAQETVGQANQSSRLVLLKFTEEATESDIEATKQRFCALGRSYKGIEEAVWIEDKALCQKSAYTHAVMLRFSCPKAANEYRSHPQCVQLEKEAPGIIASWLEMKYQLDESNVSRPSA